MRIDWASRTDEILDMAGFLEQVEAKYDPLHPATAWELRSDLLKLGNNPELVQRLILKSVFERLEKDISSELPTYHYLHKNHLYSIRATIWLPESSRSEIRRIENGTFAYDYPHNHDFDLLTVTCLGGGYETEIYELDPSGKLNFTYASNETVEATHRGRFRLSPGTVFLYEAQKDVHSQIPVESLTVALNFLPVSPNYLQMSQYAFNILDSRRLQVSGSPINFERQKEIFSIMAAKLINRGSLEMDILGMMSSLNKAGGGESLAKGLVRAFEAGADIHETIGVSNRLLNNYADTSLDTRRRRTGEGW